MVQSWIVSSSEGTKTAGWRTRRAEGEKNRGKEVRGIHSDKQACPRREGNEALRGLGSSYRQAERGGKVCWDAAQSDGHLPRCGNASIANQPLLKRQPIMRPLRTRQRRWWERWSGRKTVFYLHLHALMPEKVHTRPSMPPAAPIPPEDGLRPDDHWMQKDAHLAWLFGGAAIPLTLLTQSTGTATADAGRIHHA